MSNPGDLKTLNWTSEDLTESVKTTFPMPPSYISFIYIPSNGVFFTSVYLTYGFSSSFKGVSNRLSTSADILDFAVLNKGWLARGWAAITVLVGVDASNSDRGFFVSAVTLVLTSFPSLLLISANLLNKGFMCCCYELYGVILDNTFFLTASS